jgi:hypothetical protein
MVKKNLVLKKAAAIAWTTAYEERAFQVYCVSRQGAGLTGEIHCITNGSFREMVLGYFPSTTFFTFRLYPGLLNSTR